MWFLKVLCFLLFLWGCSGNQTASDKKGREKTAGTNTPNSEAGESAPLLSEKEIEETRNQIRELLPQAAGISIEDYIVLANSPTPPAITSLENQPLSLVLMGLSPVNLDASPKALNQEIRSLENSPPTPRNLLEAMLETRDKGYATMLQPKGITEITCEIRGGEVQGTISFRLKDLLQGLVKYSAQKGNQGWQITEFHLPAWDAHTKLKEGRWTASGAGLFPRIDLKRPQADFLLARSKGVSRVPVFIGVQREPDGKTWRCIDLPRKSTRYTGSVKNAFEKADHILSDGPRLAC